MCHHRCGGILDGGVMFVVKYGQLSTVTHWNYGGPTVNVLGQYAM
jgi:hypothetical protein